MSTSKFLEHFLLKELLTKIAKPIKFKPVPLTKKSKFLETCALIPGLSSLLSSANITGEVLNILLVRPKDPLSSMTAQTSMQWADLGLAAVNFIRIPFIYLAAALLGEKVPFTLSKTAQWGYAAALLALAILTLALPTVALTIMLVSASLGLGSSLFTFGRLLYQRHQIKKELEHIDDEIKQEEARLQMVQQEAERYINTREEILWLARTEILALNKEHAHCREKLQELYNKKELYEYKLAKRSDLAIVDKGVSIFLSAGVLAGLILAIFMPPIGFAIVGAFAGAGLAYLLSRLTFFSEATLGLSTKKMPETSDNENPAIEDNGKKDESLLKIEKGSEVVMESALGISPLAGIVRHGTLDTASLGPNKQEHLEIKTDKNYQKDEEGEGDGDDLHPN